MTHIEMDTYDVSVDTGKWASLSENMLPGSLVGWAIEVEYKTSAYVVPASLPLIPIAPLLRSKISLCVSLDPVREEAGQRRHWIERPRQGNVGIGGCRLGASTSLHTAGSLQSTLNWAQLMNHSLFHLHPFVFNAANQLCCWWHKVLCKWWFHRIGRTWHKIVACQAAFPYVPSL